MWISEDTWRWMNQRTALRRTHTAGQRELRTAMRRFQTELKEDRRCRARKAGEDIETLVETDQMREEWSKIQRWYQEANGHPTPPTRKGLEHT